MAELHLQCDTCNEQLTLTSTDPALQFFIENYSKIDKVTGKVFEIECPVCPGILEKIPEKTQNTTDTKQTQKHRG